MKTSCLRFLPLAALALLISCNLMSKPAAEEDFRPDASKIEKTLNDFYSLTLSPTRAGASPTLSVKRISSFGGVESRSDDAPCMIVADFEVDGQDGFALLYVLDDNDYKVAWFTDNGTLEQAEECPAFHEMFRIVPPPVTPPVDSLPDSLRNLFPNWADSMVMVAPQNSDPLILTSWHQRSPFNDQMPYCECEECAENPRRALAGCGPIAVAQAIARMRHFVPSIPQTRNPRLTNIGLHSSLNHYDSLLVGWFILDVANHFATHKYHDRTGTDTIALRTYMESMGILCHWQNSFSLTKFVNMYNNIYPLISVGYRYEASENKYKGHVWLTDGVLFDDENNEVYFHCNWGWGGNCNGWVLNDYYTAYNQATGYAQVGYPLYHKFLYIDEIN